MRRRIAILFTSLLLGTLSLSSPAQAQEEEEMMQRKQKENAKTAVKAKKGTKATVKKGTKTKPKTKGKTLSLDEIIRRTNQTAYYQGKDGRAKVTMTIRSKSGSKRVRQFTVLRRNADKGEDQSFYLYFHKPADVSKMVFIARKHVNSEDERWLYLPGLDLVKRIGASDERTSFVGSDVFYEDVSGRNPAADNHKLVKSSKNYYVIESTPKKPDSVEFTSYKMWVHRGSFLPTKIEFYDKKGAAYRVMTVESVDTIQGFSTATKATVRSLRSGTSTTIEYSNVEYNVGLPAKVFGQRYLRRAPQKYLK